MPRKLKAYQTSIGFFDLAIAAPSMKAALEAWGSKANLFHQGFAKETNDPVIIAATMAKPGIVLKRAVGSNSGYSDRAELPKNLPADEIKATLKKRVPKEPAAPPPSMVNDRAVREGAVAYEREQKRRERERTREEAARRAERERRDRAITKAETALEKAKQTHEETIAEIAAARLALDRQVETEETRWDAQRAKLEAELNQAKE